MIKADYYRITMEKHWMQISILSATSILYLTFIKERIYGIIMQLSRFTRQPLYWWDQCSTFFYAYNATCTDILSFSPLDAREIGVKGARRLASFMLCRLSREMPHSVQLDRWEVTLPSPPLGSIKRRRFSRFPAEGTKSVNPDTVLSFNCPIPPTPTSEHLSFLWRQADSTCAW